MYCIKLNHHSAKLWFVRIVGSLGLFGGVQLSYLEWQTSTACPDLISGVPACYVATSLFVLILLGSFNRRGLWVAVAASIGGLLLSGPATTLNLIYGEVCPVTSAGFPMCYIAFGLFTISLISLIWYILKNKSR